MKSTFFPHFTIGVDAYDAIPDICLDYGKTAVIVGGEKSRAAASSTGMTRLLKMQRR